MSALHPTRMRALPGAPLLVLVGVTGAAIAALATSRAHPLGGFAGRSVLGGALELSAATALALAGALRWSAGAREGLLIALAGVLWLLQECSNPDIGVAALFTLGLIGAFAPVPIVVFVALSRPPSPLRRPAALVSCIGLVALGLVPTLTFDPRAQGCLTCPRNLLLVRGDAPLSLDLSRWGIRIAILSLIIAVAAIAVDAVRKSIAALVGSGPVLAAAVLYLGLVVADLGHSASRAVLSNDDVDVALWRAQGAALALLALALIRDIVRWRRRRLAMAALVVDVGNATRTGGVRGMLVQALGDPTIELVYRRLSGPGYVDIGGGSAAAERGPERSVTAVPRDDHEIGLVLHDKRLLAEPEILTGTIAAARLAIENEQLQAELNAQAIEIRASRLRIVRDGDRARRLLERDLHDGAQQRLVALSMMMPLLRRRARSAAAADAIDVAHAALRAALDELREVAHGIYPASLRDDGLAAALEDLVERSPVKVTVCHLPGGRSPATVEEAAYFAVAEIVEDMDEHEGLGSIMVKRTGPELRVTVCRPGPVTHLDQRVLAISDRVGALDGTVDVSRGGNEAVELRVSIPCA